MRLPIQYIGVWKKFEAKWKKLFCRRQFSVYLAVSCRTNRELEKYNARRKVSNAHFYENNQAKYIQLFYGRHRKDFSIMNFCTTSIHSKSINPINQNIEIYFTKQTSTLQKSTKKPIIS